jgi:hypothetical protein
MIRSEYEAHLSLVPLDTDAQSGHHYVKRQVHVPMWQRLLNRLFRQHL